MQHVPAQPPLAQGSAQSPIAVSPQPHAHSHSHPHARPAGNVPMQSAPTQSTPTQAAPTQNAPAQPGTTAPPAPKRKRVQVPAACMQCKKAHAACSYTRPCDRCVRINQAAQCVSSPFPSTLRGTGEVSYLENIPFPIENGAVDSTSLATPVPPLTSAPSAVPPSPVPVTFMNTSIGENELSRFLFEDNADFTNMEIPMFESVETHSPCGQFPQTTPPTTSPSSASSSSSSSTSPTNSPVPSPAPSTVSTPALPTQMDQSDSTMYHNFGPPQTAPTSNMSASTIAAVIASGASNSQNYPQDVLRQGIPPTPQTPLETMMSEMLNQNKRMEGLVGSMHQEIASLKQELTNIKSGPTAVTKLDKSGASVPGTAVWSIQEGVLLEYNERFCNIVELKEIPQGYRMQHFFGGPCSNAAKARMNQHLSNLQNSQPATDYAVVERKKLSGEVMRLMIVVNVIPTPIPVFLTVMWEL